MPQKDSPKTPPPAPAKPALPIQTPNERFRDNTKAINASIPKPISISDSKEPPPPKKS
jgi:hypothetical protein